MTDDDRADLRERERHNASPDRVVAFSDGVFAIIITLLVLDLRVPDLGSGLSLRQALTDIWPTFVSFVISFLLPGMYWDWHRGASRRSARSTATPYGSTCSSCSPYR